MHMHAVFVSSTFGHPIRRSGLGLLDRLRRVTLRVEHNEQREQRREREHRVAGSVDAGQVDELCQVEALKFAE